MYTLIGVISLITFINGLSDASRRKNKIITFLMVAQPLLILLGTIFLWDFSNEDGSLAVIKNGKVVEMNRTFVWTWDGTRTIYSVREKNYQEKAWNVSAYDVDGRVLVRVIYRYKKLPDIKWVEARLKMENDGYRWLGKMKGISSVVNEELKNERRENCCLEDSGCQESRARFIKNLTERLDRYGYEAILVNIDIMPRGIRQAEND